MRLLGILLIGALLAGCGLIRSESSATRDSLVVVINPQEVGIITNRDTGEIEGQLLSGIYTIDPQQEVTFYFTGQQEYTMMSNPATDPQPHGDAIDTISLDGEEIWMDVTLLYAIDPSSIEAIHLNWGQTYAEDLIRPTIRSIVRDTVSEFTAEQTYMEARADMEAQMQERITERLNEEGFIVIDLLLRDMQFTEEYSHIIESTLIAELTVTAAARVTATPTP